ncbi:hypothetical protein [Bradyrhizobium sp. CCGUVB14]|uniref:hypothetical protein n=1 Tax=Bradyrhizobium sp. CCGUVB14 TaxID=2949628 RepID=UPI0020B2C581|nr:hypothetical protein [Bradyrhizobium sp. CCGUVB14]MCP3444588.1 hypothetical protein [Bradyrhizobium sp. CCGUVB14]
MRYYRIEIDGGKTVFTSYLNGQNIRGALQVELDIPIAAFHSPGNAGAFVKVWGIPLSMISQAKDLNFKTIKVYGGFKPGLPLASLAAKQAGLLVQGYISQSFGNWQGTDMSLDLIISPGVPPAEGGPAIQPKNISLNWKKGQNASDAIKAALTTGYPGMTVKVNLNGNLVAPEDSPGIYGGVKAFAEYLFGASKSIINRPDYQGVQISMDGNTINVTDQPNTKVKDIAFVDLIGQPTWIEPFTIAFKCAMRADITLSDPVRMPKTLIKNTAQAQSSLINQSAAQQGTFLITSVHHYGNFRQHDAYSWVTEFNAIATNVQGTT